LPFRVCCATTPVGSLGSPAALRSLAAISVISSSSGPAANTARREHGRLGGQVERRRALGMRVIGDRQVLARFGVRSVEHRRQLM
jgi:hypothetical protein